MNVIYLDHAATTPLHDKVKKVMFASAETVLGNPSSTHAYGRKARKQLEAARRLMAQSIGANETDIIFTSGGTEADNLALIGVALANQAKGKHIITTKQEHQAVLHAAAYLETLGFEVSYLPVAADGQVAVTDLVQALREDTILVSIIYANNETGVVQPIAEIGALLKKHQAYFHTDAVQAYGTLMIDVEALGIDLLSVSAHKINGPQGVGFLYKRQPIQLQAMLYGGQQERGRRAGTENLLGVIGFQKAVEIMLAERTENVVRLQACKDVLVTELTKQEVAFAINGDQEAALASIINISFPGTEVATLLQRFDLAGIAVSSGSACTAGTYQPSHVLTAMYGEESERRKNSVRFSFGLNQSVEMITEAAEQIGKIVKKIQQ